MWRLRTAEGASPNALENSRLAFEVASSLNAPLDVLVTCKLSAPGVPEFTLGAIASGGVTVISDSAMDLFRDSGELSGDIAQQQAELRHREIFYRGARQPVPIEGKTVILVDDGAATGATMRAAIRVVRELGAGRVVASLPVASLPACELLHAEADEVVCEITPAFLGSIGDWYGDFAAITDGDVRGLLTGAGDVAEQAVTRARPAGVGASAGQKLYR